MNKFGWLELRDGNEGRAGDVPAFKFAKWHEGFRELPRPQSGFGLSLGYTDTTDEGLKDLAGFHFLQSLELFRTQVTDAGLKELAGLKSLQSLNLSGTCVTNAGLEHLAGMETLQALTLFDTKVTDAGLKHLARLRSLRSLKLATLDVTNAGLKAPRSPQNPGVAGSERDACDGRWTEGIGRMPVT